MSNITYKSFCERAVVIPASLRRKFAIESGMAVKIIEVNGSIQIIPLPKDPIAAARFRSFVSVRIASGKTNTLKAFLIEY